MNAAAAQDPKHLTGSQPPHSALDAPGSGLVPPQRGRRVLACRCGIALDLADMHRPSGNHASSSPRSGFRIEPIRCRDCALSR